MSGRFAVVCLVTLLACTGPTAASIPAPPAPAPPVSTACTTGCPASKIEHLVVVVQENHTFDNHFGRYCRAAAGSDPSCTTGPDCCEGAPEREPSGTSPVVLDDDALVHGCPQNAAACAIEEIDGGKMDRFVTAACAAPGTFALADPAVIAPYWDLAASGALGDRYFQPTVGQSSANMMYFARAAFVFADDNDPPPKDAIGSTCLAAKGQEFPGPTLGDLLTEKGVSWTVYAGGYQAMVDAVAKATCPAIPDGCGAEVQQYPCLFDPGDVPFAYFASTRDRPEHMKDLSRLSVDIAAGTLPAVSLVRAVGYESEHPGTRLSDGVAHVRRTVDAILASRYQADTLVLLTYDEGGGYFDHVPPPPTSGVDHKPYGTRVPFVALGTFARKNFVSHVVMEHSSIVKFVEHNWLGGTGQLGTRDAIVHNIGSVLDPARTGAAVPE